MRKVYLRVLRKFFYTRLVETRALQGLTQAEMAELLVMDSRSFIDLDHGKTCCSALTLALFLIYCCPDPIAFLADLRQELEKEAAHAA